VKGPTFSLVSGFMIGQDLRNTNTFKL